jgi:hypothetical protein
MGLRKDRAGLILLAVFLVAFVLGALFAKQMICQGDTPQADTTYIYDTVIYEIPTEIPVADTLYIHQPYPVEVEVIKHDTIPLTDTVFIFAEWQTERVYYDTLQDAKLRAYLHERVQFNRITHRDFSYQILSPTEVITQHKNQHFVFAQMRIYGNSADAGFALSLDYANERFIGGIGYDFTRNYVFVEAGIPILKW